MMLLVNLIDNCVYYILLQADLLLIMLVNEDI